MGGSEIIYSGQLLLAIPIAVLAGLVSFASPCILPLVPGYLAYVGGLSSGAVEREAMRRDRARMLTGVALFILGFAVVFVAYGAAFGAVGLWLIQWQDLVVRILGVLVIVMGLVFIGQFTFMQNTMKPTWRPATGMAGAPMLGIVFGLGWTPCIGPALASILALGMNGGSPWRGALLAFLYCLGLGIPFLLVALGLNWVTRSVAFLKKHIRAINIAGGALLILLGVLMVTGVWSFWIDSLQAVIPTFVPAI